MTLPPINSEHPKRLIVAIDGPAASGKSTTAKLVAQELGYLYIDTGAMYRAITLEVIRRQIPADDHDAITNLAASTSVELIQNNGNLIVLMDGQDVTGEIRTPEVSRWVSPVSAIPGVRERLVQLQRELGKNGGVILEGRDIGTVVFPHADLKIYLKASLEKRAERRHLELENRGIPSTIEEQAMAIAARDEYDSGRVHSPLRQAADAIIIDTSDMTIDDQVRAVRQLVEKQT